jgi:hypothetical protein
VSKEVKWRIERYHDLSEDSQVSTFPVQMLQLNTYAPSPGNGSAAGRCFKHSAKEKSFKHDDEILLLLLLSRFHDMEKCV